MKVKVFTVMVLFAIAGCFAFTSKVRPVAAQGKMASLISRLPASDGVAVIDARRAVNDAMPKLLAANQPMLTKAFAAIDQIDTKIGLDLKKFDSIAVGYNVVVKENGAFDIDPVILARGEISPDTLLAMIKLGSNGTFREEKVGDKTLYIFSSSDIANKHAAKAKDPNAKAAIEFAGEAVNGELAVTALDNSTFAFGTADRVKSTLAHNTSISAEIAEAIVARENSVAAFASGLPAGLSAKLPTDNDELGKLLSSIRFMAGSFDTNETGAALNLIAKAGDPNQAKSIYSTLSGLKKLGSGIFSKSKRPDQQMYGRLIAASNIANNGDTVSLDVSVPQADLNTLVSKFGK